MPDVPIHEHELAPVGAPPQGGRSARVDIASPKQPQPERKRDWYPYYAGFTQAFAYDVIEAFASRAVAIVDPWNGAGTTSAACASRGISSGGSDINPALNVIARARLASREAGYSAISSLPTLLSVAKSDSCRVSADDPLAGWLRPAAIARIRRVQIAIHAASGGSEGRLYNAKLPVGADELSPLTSFHYAVLFAALRDLLRQFRTSNPTWIRKSRAPGELVDLTWKQISEAMLRRAHYLSERLILNCNLDSGAADIRTCSAVLLPWPDRSFNAAVTSPPYATRIDYIKSTLLELALLGYGGDQIDELRARCTGSPVVKGKQLDPETELRSECARHLLQRMATHESKASATYYSRWMRGYLLSLQRGLFETHRVVEKCGPIAIVVQDSHYKQLRVELQSIVIDMMTSAGRGLEFRQDFSVVHHRARMNPRSRLHLPSRNNSETLLVFR